MAAKAVKPARDQRGWISGKAAAKGPINPASFNWLLDPLVDPKNNPDLVAKRIQDYFNATDTPTYTGLAVALGVSVDTVKRWETRETFGPDGADGMGNGGDGKFQLVCGLIKRASAYLLDWTVSNAIRNRINPVFSMFYIKNKWGWVDKQESTTNVNFELGDKLQAYLESARTKQVTD